MLPRVRYDLRELPGYHSPQLDVDVRLNTNEAPSPPPAGFVSEFTSRLSDLEWNRYPDRSAMSLRRAIARHEGVAAANVFVANGSNEVLQTLCLTYGGRDRTVLTFEPTYAMHGQIARTVQCSTVEAERGDRFEVVPGVLAAEVEDHSPAIVFLCSPNNPTGTAETVSTIRDALDIVPGLLVVDEAYGQFASFSAATMIGDDVPLVVTRTFSKTWAMAGIRLGYALGPPAIIAELEKLILPYHLDAMKQLAGEVALDFVAEMDARVSQIVSERQRLAGCLEAENLRVYDSEANFLLFRTTPAGLSGDQVWQALVDRSILVRNCSGWPRLSDCLRVTVGTPAENDRFLEAMSEIVSDHVAATETRTHP